MTGFQAIQQKYYEHREVANTHFGGQIDDIENYVNAVEEREKTALDTLIKLYDSEYGFGLSIDQSELKNIIEELTGQSIEEVLKR